MTVRRPAVIRRLAFALLVAAALVPRSARAHHVPGGEASEGVRNLSSFGVGSVAAQSRVMVLQEVSHATIGLNPGTTSNTVLLGEYGVHPWVSIAALAPLLVVAPRGQAPRVGYGDTRLALRITPHADKLLHRVVTVGVQASFPTRTVRLPTDPGRIWSVSSTVAFTRTYDLPFWQVQGIASVEHRPAGTAFELGATAQGGLRTRIGFVAFLGLTADVRVLNVCRRPGGSSDVCRESRATEVEREIGALRVVQSYGLGWRLPRRGFVSAQVVAPITRKRDFDVFASVGLQFSF